MSWPPTIIETPWYARSSSGAVWFSFVESLAIISGRFCEVVDAVGLVERLGVKISRAPAIDCADLLVVMLSDELVSHPTRAPMILGVRPPSRAS